MKRPIEGDELLPMCVIHRELERCLDGFRAAVCEVCSRRTAERAYLLELFAERGHVPIVKVRSAKVNELISLLCDRCDDLQMAMAGRADGDAGIAVEKNIAIGILD